MIMFLEMLDKAGVPDDSIEQHQHSFNAGCIFTGIDPCNPHSIDLYRSSIYLEVESIDPELRTSLNKAIDTAIESIKEDELSSLSREEIGNRLDDLGEEQDELLNRL